MRITFSAERLYTQSQVESLLSDYCRICDLIKYEIEQEQHLDSNDRSGVIREILHAPLKRHGKPDATTKEILYSYFSNLCDFEGGRNLVTSLEKMIESYELQQNRVNLINTKSFL